MKIKKVSKILGENKERKKEILSVVGAGISLGLFVYLQKANILNFDNAINIEQMRESVQQFMQSTGIQKIPGMSKINEISLNIGIGLAKGVNAVGLGNILTILKGKDLLSKTANLLSDGKIKNNPTVMKIRNIKKIANEKIKQLLNGKSKPKQDQQTDFEKEDSKKENRQIRNSKVIKKVITKNAIGISSLIGNIILLNMGGVNFGNSIATEKLPHFIVEFLKKVGINNFIILKQSLKLGRRIVKDKNEIQNLEGIKVKSMKEVLHKFSESVKKGKSLPQSDKVKGYVEKLNEVKTKSIQIVKKTLGIGEEK